jgi:hypothetical protein
MTASSLDQVLTPLRRSEHEYDFTVPEGWDQGWAAFGGLLVGGVVRAMQTHINGSGRSLRGLHSEIVSAAKVGESTIELNVTRTSKTVTTMHAELLQDGNVVVVAMGTFGDARPFPMTWHAPWDGRPTPWEEVPPLDVNAPFFPSFTRHFEYRPMGPVPYSAASPARTAGWIRPRTPAALRDAAYIAALGDAWWVSTLAGLGEPRPVATMSFTLDIHGECVGLAAEAPLLHYGETVAMTAGYATEVRELRGEDGRLIALNRQLVAVVK